VLFVAIFSVAHPSFITWLWAGPGEPGWAAAHTHWALVGLGALFIFGALSRDPAAPPAILQRRLPSR
jgi:hypothetical protein